MFNKLIVLSIIFFPLHNFGLHIYGSRYDITSFIILLITVALTVKNDQLNKKTILFLFLFLFSQLLIYFVNGTTPFYRTFSGMVWVGGLLLLLLSAKRITYNPIVIYKTIMMVILISAVLLLFQYFILVDARPKATFDEPSKAALAVFSAAASIVGLLYFFKIPSKYSMGLFVIFIISFLSGLITFSMHIVTFILMIIIILFLKPPLTFTKIRSRQLLLFSFISILFLYGLISLSEMPYFLSKIDIFNVLNNNLSVLSWRTGFDQMVASINQSYLLGKGLGSTGFIDFESNSLDKLLYLTPMGLNLNDAYSLSFRLIIEIGLLLFIVIVYYFIKKLLIFKKYLSNKIYEVQLPNSIPITFIFLFSTSIIIGSLIKEPLYPASSLYLGTMLFVSIKINP